MATKNATKTTARQGTDPRAGAKTSPAPAPAPTAAPAPSAPPADEVKPRKRREEMVSCSVPQAFNLRLDNDELVRIEPGIQDLPRSQADHWYAKAHGVEIND